MNRKNLAVLLLIMGTGFGVFTLTKALYYSPEEEASVSLPEAGQTRLPPVKIE